MFAKKKEEHKKDHPAHEQHFSSEDFFFGEYLDKDVYESQGCYDNSKDGSGGNDNYHGGERNEEGAQEHEHGGGQSLVYDVDVLGEAVEDASYRRGVKERLGGVKFVGEQVRVQLLGCADVSRG